MSDEPTPEELAKQCDHLALHREELGLDVEVGERLHAAAGSLRALEAERDRLTRRLNAAEVFIAVRCGPDPNGDASRAYETWREIRNEDQATQPTERTDDDDRE